MQEVIGLDDEYPKDKKVLVWLETPLNPTGESRSIAHCGFVSVYSQGAALAARVYPHRSLLTLVLCDAPVIDSRRAKAVQATLGIDATFGPPPLQDPFAWGADVVMHSGTKYFAGHSDALVGTVSVRSRADWTRLWHERTYTGANIGTLDAWLLLRSLRTLEVRVRKQSETATRLAQWLASLARADRGSDLDGPGGVVKQVWHTCLQDGREELLGEGKQMRSGPATFAFLLEEPEYATHLPHNVELFVVGFLPPTSAAGSYH